MGEMKHYVESDIIQAGDRTSTSRFFKKPNILSICFYMSRETVCRIS